MILELRSVRIIFTSLYCFQNKPNTATLRSAKVEVFTEKTCASIQHNDFKTQLCAGLRSGRKGVCNVSSIILLSIIPLNMVSYIKGGIQAKGI